MPQCVDRLAGQFDSALEWLVIQPVSAKSKNGTTLTRQKDDLSFRTSSKNPNLEEYYITLQLKANQSITGFRLEALTDESLANKSLSRANGNFILTSVAAELKMNGDLQPVSIASATADYEQPGWSVANTLDSNPKSGWAVNGHVEAKNRTAIFLFAKPISTDVEAEL